jgi:hypothetical protein
MLNPFRYGKPVPPDYFFGRADSIQTVFSRLRNCESTAIVGEPHIGKSSLLRYIGDKTVWTRFAFDRPVVLLHYFDAHTLAAQAPADFWGETIDFIGEHCQQLGIGDAVEYVKRSAFRSQAMVDLFKALARRDRLVVLAIDEFDTLLHHPGFCTLEFFGLLRSLANQTDGLAVVMASRLSVAELNTRTQELSPTGSPLFNIFIDEKLRPLRAEEVDSLIDALLTGTGMQFTHEDRQFIVRLSGRHPFLVQLVGSALFDAKSAKLRRKEAYLKAAESAAERARPFFDDLWRHLEPRAQVGVVAVFLSEAGGDLTWAEFNTSDLARQKWYGPELGRLADAGLIEPDQTGTIPWRLTAAAFASWLTNDLIAHTRRDVDFENWLHEREFDGLLTRGQKEKVKSAANAVPKGAVTWAGNLLCEVLKKQLK